MTPETPASYATPPAPPEPWRLPAHRRVGVLFLILTEAALFTIFVIAYLFYIGKSLNPPYPHQVLEFPYFGTVALLASSITVVIAEKALARNALGKFHLWLGITIALGLGFIGYTAKEWYRLIYHDGLIISTNVFGSTFYSLVGLHASHVLVGLALLTTCLIAGFRGKLGREHFPHFEAVSWYWHFVDAIWIIVVTVVYIISAKPF